MPLRAIARCLPGAEVQVPARSSGREGAKPGWEDITHPTALEGPHVCEGRGGHHGHQRSSAGSSDPLLLRANRKCFTTARTELAAVQDGGTTRCVGRARWRARAAL